MSWYLEVCEKVLSFVSEKVEQTSNMSELTLRRRRTHLGLSRSIKGKVLKTCVLCRQRKTRCDAAVTMPKACTHCSKRNIDCTLGIVDRSPAKPSDMVSKLTSDVHTLKVMLDKMIQRKTKLVASLLNLVEEQKYHDTAMTMAPSISHIRSFVDSPVSTPVPLTPESPISDSSYIIRCDTNATPVALSHEEVLEHFSNYEKHFNKYLPIFPENFFKNLHLQEFYEQQDMLFWCIIATSFLNKSDASKYFVLSKHIMSLTVQKCWLNTPRSVYVLCALLILTTWPLPTDKSIKDNNEKAMKYISLMRSISLQLGLHRSEFINEFSYKTEMNFSDDLNMNNIIRKRIYKLICINSNYWSVYLGLPHVDYDGWHQDYIINKATQDLNKTYPINEEETYIDSLLRISLIQLKLNENILEIVSNGATNNPMMGCGKQINMQMFKIILDDLKTKFRFQKCNKLVELSIEYLKLQLYIYLFSQSDVTLDEYQGFLGEAIESCFSIVDLAGELFKDIQNFSQLPIHYRFPVELASLVLLRVHFSPLLPSKQKYSEVKHEFRKCYEILTANINPDWLILNGIHLKILRKFNEIFSKDPEAVIKNMRRSFQLISKMKNYLVSSLKYEMMWSIFQNSESFMDDSKPLKIDWEYFTERIAPLEARKIKDYLASECSSLI